MSKAETTQIEPDTTSKTEQQIDYKNELARKAIHLSSISIPIVYFHISRELALLLLFPLFLGFFLVDFLRIYVKPISKWYYKTFSSMLRAHELDDEKPRFNGATYVTFSACLVVAFFPKMIAIAAFSILIISDSVAALIGRKFGRHKIAGKSFEGSFAFFVSAILIVLNTPKLDLMAGIIMSAVATIVELYPIKFLDITIDDNLTVPIIGAIASYLYYMIFLQGDISLICELH
ncbi:phosphatidate cytidylyltransferase [Chloroherpeton thalassium ATCC 35110]|uniref:Phosphatidate cytidylyltransferase n=1 Tax=Chloroherpeton thalassium (strain ATCC 35110 / GB-78) TaxID=517418 RepID=B3QU86_CHLT3|nr:diacylglycerol/polyprenol kinase family protein [Chloroherpeton thalassium]ACF14335.1 phosphatidate cytidylyltransferase [Chloroherpeton thalassium ATCC 35110]